jgi:hypothetical protein
VPSVDDRELLPYAVRRTASTYRNAFADEVLRQETATTRFDDTDTFGAEGVRRNRAFIVAAWVEADARIGSDSPLVPDDAFERLVVDAADVMEIGRVHRAHQHAHTDLSVGRFQ